MPTLLSRIQKKLGQSKSGVEQKTVLGDPVDRIDTHPVEPSFREEVNLKGKKLKRPPPFNERPGVSSYESRFVIPGNREQLDGVEAGAIGRDFILQDKDVLNQLPRRMGLKRWKAWREDYTPLNSTSCVGPSSTMRSPIGISALKSKRKPNVAVKENAMYPGVGLGGDYKTGVNMPTTKALVPVRKPGKNKLQKEEDEIQSEENLDELSAENLHKIYSKATQDSLNKMKAHDMRGSIKSAKLASDAYVRIRRKELGEHIVKIGTKFRLISKKNGRNLGTFPNKMAAERREKQVEYFKNVNESVSKEPVDYMAKVHKALPNHEVEDHTHNDYYTHKGWNHPTYGPVKSIKVHGNVNEDQVHKSLKDAGLHPRFAGSSSTPNPDGTRHRETVFHIHPHYNPKS